LGLPPAPLGPQALVALWASRAPLPSPGSLESTGQLRVRRGRRGGLYLCDRRRLRAGHHRGAGRQGQAVAGHVPRGLGVLAGADRQAEQLAGHHRGPQQRDRPRQLVKVMLLVVCFGWLGFGQVCGTCCPRAPLQGGGQRPLLWRPRSPRAGAFPCRVVARCNRCGVCGVHMLARSLAGRWPDPVEAVGREESEAPQTR
jgi:hypothetical protein